MKKRALILLVALGASPAWAGVVDTPLPAPFTQHVFTVPGVIDQPNLATYFTCTNLDSVNVTMGVEIFGALGGGAANDAVGNALSVAPGGTVTFGTAAAASIAIDSNVGAGLGGKGSARILATSKKITCTAAVVDPGNAVPTAAWQLTIIAKTKQKAAN